MKFIIPVTAGAFALALAATAAGAADLPAPPAEMPAIAAAPMAYYDWSGFYIGANVGYAWGDTKTTNKVKPDLDHDSDGFLGGGQIGVNWQMGTFVLGLESDIAATGIDGTKKKGADSLKTEMNWLGTTRGRLGFAWDRFLLFASGGAAYGDVDATRSNGKVSRKDSQTQFGWTVGGGIEGAITDNITLKLEYLYVDLGSENYDFSAKKSPFLDRKLDFTASIVRAGINYKF